MKVLVVGSGGREHALCTAIAKSPQLTKLYCAPGNPGIADVAECVPIGTHQKREIVNFANFNQIDLVVIGPEAPLVAGLVDDLLVFGIKCVGPNKEMAQLEGSKSYTKELCKKLDIPTAEWEVYDNPDAALQGVKAMAEQYDYPVVIKANGLAAGKGVIIAENYWHAVAAIDRIMIKQEFETNGRSDDRPVTVVVERFLRGTEASFFVLSDGNYAIPFGTAQDYKRLCDYDLGPNTGGMGAISPAPAIDDTVTTQIWERIILPTIKETGFKGILFAGLMITEDGPKLIEFNVRFGDPECQAILQRLETDILPVLYAAASGNVLPVVTHLKRMDKKSVAVVMAAPGYPDDPLHGVPVFINENISEATGTKIYHAGTKLRDDGVFVSAGGRVLTIVGVGDTYDDARGNAYTSMDFDVDFDGGLYRTDIGKNIDTAS